MSELERIRAFTRGIGERAAARIEPFQHGRAYLSESLPVDYDRNIDVV
jgi:hypothetical protein